MPEPTPERIHVATRKGLLTFEPDVKGWRSAPAAFLGDSVSATLKDPRDGALYAALNLGHFGVKLHRSDDGGASWAELEPPAFPRRRGAPSVSLLWTVVAGGADRPGELWIGTIPGGLFRSTDRGGSWALVESLWNRPERRKWFGGGYDNPGIHSICIDPRDPRRMTLGVSSGGVWLSGNRGGSWRQGGKGLRAAYLPPKLAYSTVNQDPHRLAQSPSDPDVIWCQHHNGIFLSRDRGATFREIEAEAPSRFGFAAAVHPKDPATAWFVPAVKDERRVPVDGKLVITRTRDFGESFEVLDKGLPAPSFDLIYRHALAVDATGKWLAMGSTSGNLWISDNGGVQWSLLSNYLPPIVHVAFG